MGKKKKRPAQTRRVAPRPQPRAPLPVDDPSIAPGPEGTVDLGKGEAVPAPVAVPAAAVGVPGGVRRVQRVEPGARRVARPRSGTPAATFEPLPPEDSSIPFDRVPYVPADLKRVLVMAGVAIVVIIIAAIVVSTVVK